MSKSYLFTGDLSGYLEIKKSEIKEKIEGLSEEYILNVSEEDLVKSLEEKYILNPPILKIDEIYQLDPKDIDVEIAGEEQRLLYGRAYIKGTLFTIIIPFEGDGGLFNYRPSSFFPVFPQGEIHRNELFLKYTIINHNRENLKRMIDHDIELIQSYLEHVKRDVDNFNNLLEDYIRNLITTRKEKFLKDRNLARSLEIPIKKRSDTPWTYSIPVKPKKISIELPEVKSEKFNPEPTLAIEIYEEILKLLESMALVMERSPRTFSKLKEEELRNFFLVILNSQFEGEAMGEVFNNEGKTDILIRHKNSNVFIAECKFWRGEKAFSETIDQLFKYVTWRDTKLAILIFNKKGNLKTILEKIPILVEKHTLYKRTIKIEGETKFIYVFHVPNDPNREAILTVMVFDIPKEKSGLEQ